jgi:arylsulfatase A-like enzyme
VCARAADWFAGLAQAGGESKGGEPQPWFGIVSLEAPHPPYAAPAGDIVARNPDLISLAPNVPRGGAVEQQARCELAGYHAHIEATDRAVGKLVAAVDGLARRRRRPLPVIVFTSVHGDMHGAHGLFRKGWPHEESVRVPLLVRGPVRPEGSQPGGREPARTNDRPISLLDLSAMTTAWADGRDPHPGPDWAAISMPCVVDLPQQCDRVWRGVRNRKRKLVLEGSGAPWLFFDLERDPWERENLAADPGRRNELEALRKSAALAEGR